MENKYQTKVSQMNNKQLDAEFKRINTLRNETDNDYPDEFRILNQDYNRREYELPDEITDEEINFNANEFSGYVNWVRYDFINKTLEVTYRLDDTVYIFIEVPRSEFQKLKISDDVDSFMKEFENRYHGEEL